MLQSLTDCLDIVTEQQPQRQTERCADHADKRAVHKENPHNHPFGCPHRAQNRHIAPFVFHQHNQAGNNIKGRHDYNQGQDDKHHVPFNVYRIKKSGIALFPIINIRTGTDAFFNRFPHRLDHFVVIQCHVNIRHRSRQTEINLGRFQRHKDKIGIIFKHSDFKSTQNLVRLHPRHGSESRHLAVRRNQGNLVPGNNSHFIGQTNADNNVVTAEIFGIDVFYTVAENVLFQQIIFGNSPDHRPLRCFSGRNQKLVFNHRNHGFDIVKLGNFLSSLLIVVKRHAD